MHRQNHIKFVLWFYSTNSVTCEPDNSVPVHDS